MAKDLSATVDEQKTREKLLRDDLEQEQRRSRELFREIQSMKGNIRVMCRIRPAPADTPQEELADFGPRERGEYSNHWAKMCIPQERKDFKGDIVTESRNFSFERIFGQEESNDDIFNEVSDLAELALSGKNVGVFAYGQTGSGKTYTLSNQGSPDTSNDGIIPRTLALLFETAEKGFLGYKYSISVSILEIYLDNVYDLLQTSPTGEKVTTMIEGASSFALESLEAAQEIINMATGMRASSSTNKNAASSRSHLILTFKIGREPINTTSQEQVKDGILNLIDLAGSERPAASGMGGQQLQEGKKINQSLLSLNRAIAALGQGTQVAYDDPLLRALRPCLTAGSKTLMFVMVSPFKRDLSVSIQTLEKGQEATNAKLAAARRGNNPRPSKTPTPPPRRPLASSRPSPASNRPPPRS
ncbi:P-loop containing nucleoside triphosphate hydrolase protein [Durotheca rogersii]|uniref:P-loop containing nucleoside triphosphate hydrolase protein n=1 Tax=Durotheca rogersii TaxID=419775 RepID=UPI00221F784A|nr:P-loop containing nucleoside triphosphate hydrolase protein [Durotheca rogersii]KAI5866736.1 P-loop containing nucleoside triphosphate hydrolase protein [Durotheca rogersii]